MNLNELLNFLNESFEDQRLSRNEASVFRQLLDEAALNNNELSQLRKHIFTKASEVVRHPHDREVLDWVESLMRVMLVDTDTQQELNEAHFFPSEKGLQRLLSCLASAKTSLDICVFTITDNRISNAIVDAHKRGVKVRVISDNDKASDLGSDVVSLSDAGVPIAVDNEPDHMHHKFAVVDKTILINGSFNWTRSASSRNFENIVLTNQPKLVQSFLQEFERLWTSFRG